jgi:hypothetical protein
VVIAGPDGQTCNKREHLGAIGRPSIERELDEKRYGVSAGPESVSLMVDLSIQLKAGQVAHSSIDMAK